MVIASGLDAAIVSNVGSNELAAATVVDVNAANVGAELIVVSARVVSKVVLVLGVVNRLVVLVDAMYGYEGQGSMSWGPSIDSKTYPIREPAVRPTLYDNVIMFPVTSFRVAGTFAGASIIGSDPARPFVTPSAELKTNAAASPAITGLFRGAQHRSSNGIRQVRIPDKRIS